MPATTEVYAHKRASLNNVFKTFVNDVSADPLVYTGTGREKIQAAVGQTLCWALSADWQGLPDEQELCTPDNPNFASRGRRVRVHHAQSRQPDHDRWLAASDPGARGGGQEPPRGPARRAVLQDRDIKVFMLASQLPLLQSGLEPASIRDAVAAYCRPDRAHYADRLFKETELIAFSDPNDLLSYPIPNQFVRENVDSRLCPRQVNVTINIAPVTNLLGVGELANPMAAHVDYDDDERVIGLITRGIGQPETAPVVEERRTWLELAKTCADRAGRRRRFAAGLAEWCGEKPSTFWASLDQEPAVARVASCAVRAS